MRRSLRVAVLASACALAGVIAAGTLGARNSALATNSGSLSVSVSAPSVFEGNNFTVAIMQTATVATSGVQADLTFDRTHLQIVSVTQGSAYTGPPASGLVAGVAPQTVSDAVNEANTSTGTFKNASAFYASTGGQPSIPAGTNQAIVITMQAIQGVNFTASIGLANPEMIEATGDSMTVSGTTGGSILIHHEDGDQCLDTKELGPSHATGGQRDPNNPWDFFDVPTPVLLPGHTTGTRSHAVTIADAIAILSYIGTTAANPNTANANGAMYGSDLDADGHQDGQEYDRGTAPNPAMPWAPGPPNGAVQISDAILALNSVGDNCN